MPSVDDMPRFPGGNVHPVKAEPMEIRSMPDPDAATAAGYEQALEAARLIERIIADAEAEATARERQRIRQALLERQAMLAYISTSRQVAAVLVKDIADLLDGDGDG